MRGLPGIYFHSLVGSRSWLEGVQQTGHNRTINRRKSQWAELISSLADPNARQARVFFRLSHLLKIRRRHAAFHPYSLQKVIHVAPQLFCLLRSSSEGTDHVLCMHNISDHPLSLKDFSVPRELSNPRNLIDGKFINTQSVLIEPYQTLWIASE
jgi:sucrose phosphorylase